MGIIAVPMSSNFHGNSMSSHNVRCLEKAGHIVFNKSYLYYPHDNFTRCMIFLNEEAEPGEVTRPYTE